MPHTARAWTTYPTLGLTWGLVFFGFILVTGCNTTTMKTIDTKQADHAYAEGHFATAEELYRQVLTADPDNIRALEQLGIVALWKNDLKTAVSHLQAAQRNKSWFARRWPMNITVNSHLALAYSRAGQMGEVAALLDKAAWLPYGPLKALRVRARQAALFKETGPYQIGGAVETTVPFVITDPLPVVKVAVNSADPVDFFIDTGGESLMLDADFARRTGVTIAGEVPGEYAGGEKGMTGYGKVKQIKLGDISVMEVPVACIDLQSISQSVFPGRDIKGIIGTGFLMQFLATLDYPKQQLVLRRRPDITKDVDQALRVAPRDAVFPMWLVETHFIFAAGSVNSLEPGMMFIDTGLADAGFLASKKIFHDADVIMDWTKAGMGVGGGGMTKALNVQVAEVTLGRGDQAVRRRNIQGMVFENDHSLFKGALGFKVAGLISHQFFREHAVTFDFTGMRLILQRH